MLKTQSYSLSSANRSLNTAALNDCYDPVFIFDSNAESNSNKYLHAPKLIALGCTEKIVAEEHYNALDKLQQFINTHNGWVFGYLSYDLKNDIEALQSNNADGLKFPCLSFFVPEIVIRINDAAVELIYDDVFVTSLQAEKVFEIAFSENNLPVVQDAKQDFFIHQKQSKEEYIQAVNDLKKHIQQGDIYEINYCTEFYAENAIIKPIEVFNKLNDLSKAPFAAYCKLNNHYIICSSPERYIKKSGNTLISQPIKGTIKRSADKHEDEALKQELQTSAKEQSENIMIVDLVRNDLSRIAKQGSVHVDELAKLYSFKQVHQLISTISCEIKQGITFSDIIKNTFPMGSMTGAPKVRSMQLIEQYEKSKRGVYSGAVGYIAPNGDFDFNVVIRSILYNADDKYLSFTAGSAITVHASPDEEYRECLLKARALFEALNVNMVNS